jgi:two-component system chemotaxis sensor kinase CheA
MSELSPEVLQIFREEANERLDRIEENLLLLEAVEDGAETIDALFRDAHSIKGNSGVVGLHDVRSIAHAMEDVLEQAREHAGLPRELIDPLLRATDAMRTIVAGGSVAPEPVIADLKAPRQEASEEPKAATNGKVVERRSMRVASDKVDRLLDSVGEGLLLHRRLEHLATDGASNGFSDELSRAEVLLGEMQQSVIHLRTLPLASITAPFPRAVRDLAAAQGKHVTLRMSGGETQLDRVILDGISETVVHLLRNAVTHGIELPAERERAGKDPAGRIDLRAEQRGGMVAIEVADDGRGVAPVLLREARRSGSLTEVLARPGLSTAREVTDAAGRGVGLDAVKAHVESLGGSVEVTSEPGAGTSVTLLLPLTLALLRVLLVERGDNVFGLPLGSVEEVTGVERKMILGGHASLERGGAAIALADLAGALAVTASPLPEKPPAAVVASSQRRIAVACDRLLGEEEVLVKSLGLLAGVPGYLGATILGDGRIALILDPAHLVLARAHREAAPAVDAAHAEPAKVLVVDDQFTVRELQRSILEAAGYRVVTARDGRDALDQLIKDSEIDLVATDVQMPEMDGFALLEAIRANPKRSSLPVVIVTSQGAEEQRRRGAELGADGYIVKDDFDQQALLTMVQRLVEH